MFRCQGCRNYFRTPWRRNGLGSLCSEECAAKVRSTQRGGRSRQPLETARRTPRHARQTDGSAELDLRDGEVVADTHDLVLERDRRCRYCGATTGLHVHHIVYRSQGGGHEVTNLITLCHRHHALVHSDKRRWLPVLQAYIEIYYAEGRRTFLLPLERQLAGT